MTDWRRTRHIGLDRDTIDRAARIYASNVTASQALGIAPGSFGRLCKRYGIETPKARRERSASGRRAELLQE